MDNAIISCFSSYSYTNNGCNEVLTETPSTISSSNLFSDDNKLFFYEDFFNSHNQFDQQNTTDSILVSESTSTSLLNYLPAREDIFYQPWNTTFVQQSTDNEIGLVQDARKRSAEASDAATCSLLNSETNEKEREKKRPTRFQGKLSKKHKEKKEPMGRRRTQKLTDKITTLQKLVSPYGKTDTASVLLEASISIQALQDQIEDMFHMISGEQPTNMVNISLGKSKDIITNLSGERRPDLESRGLCLVPSVVLEELDRQFPQYVAFSSEALPAVNLFAENL